MDMPVECEILVGCSADDWKQRTEAWEVDVDGGKWTEIDDPEMGLWGSAT